EQQNRDPHGLRAQLRYRRVRLQFRAHRNPEPAGAGGPERYGYQLPDVYFERHTGSHSGVYFGARPASVRVSDYPQQWRVPPGRTERRHPAEGSSAVPALAHSGRMEPHITAAVEQLD